MFAANVGVKFYTPEEFFLGAAPTNKWSWGSIDPRSLVSNAPIGPNGPNGPNSPNGAVAPLPRELVLMVGCPASGKTTLSKRLAAAGGFTTVRVCNDEIGNKKKAQRLAVEAWRAGKSVVVDNTNPSLETRKEWIDLAKSVGVSTIRCIYVKTDRAVAQHLNVFRSLLPASSALSRARVPDVVYNIYFSQFKVPTLEEGFNAIIEVPFVLEPFVDRETEELFMQWTC